MIRAVLVFGASMLAACGGGGSSDDAPGAGGAAGATQGTGGSATGGTGNVSSGGTGNTGSGLVEGFATVGMANEGLAFGPDANGETVLYVSVRDANEIVMVDSAGVSSRLATIPRPLGIAVRADGKLLVCGNEMITADGTGSEAVVWLVDPGGQPAQVLIQGDTMTPFDRTNFVTVAPDDSIIFSDSGSGRIYRTDPDGQNLSIVTSVISFPNGMAFSEDGAMLWVASSDTDTLWFVPWARSIGVFGMPQMHSSTTRGVDGVSVAANGDLFLTTSNEGVVRLDPEGTKSVVAEGSEFDGAANSAFGLGAFGEMNLYVTNLAGDGVSRLPVDVAGIALPVR